ncbi:hypothetical protein MMC25_007058 [Agyrium rufum]|nr:hypothetical protein [Agyrium rufum]
MANSHPTIQSLPPELLDQICSHVANPGQYFPIEGEDGNEDGIWLEAFTTKHLREFRLTCRQFAEVGALHYLPEVTIKKSSAGLGHLKAISEHPIIRSHVKTVVIETKVFPFLDNKRAFLEMADTRQESFPEWAETTTFTSMGTGRVIINRIPRVKADKAFQEYLTRYADQKKVSEDPDTWTQITTALSTFTGLKQIETYGSLQPRRSPSKPQEDYEKTLIFKVRFDDEQQRRNMAVEEMLCMMRGALQAGAPVENMFLEPIAQDASLPSLDSSDEGECCRLMLPKLKRMILQFLPDITYSQSNYVSITSEVLPINNPARKPLYQVIKYASNVEDLTLMQNDEAAYDYTRTIAPRTPLSRFLTLQNVPPSLRTLELASLNIEKDAFFQILKRLKGTLKQLNLDSMDLLSGRWSDFFAEMPAYIAIRETRGVQICGALSGHDPEQWYEMNTMIPCKYADRTGHTEFSLLVAEVVQGISAHLEEDWRVVHEWLSTKSVIDAHDSDDDEDDEDVMAEMEMNMLISGQAPWWATDSEEDDEDEDETGLGNDDDDGLEPAT